ncbi:hypothetical protein FCN80_10945 [Martelella alba]|uniref:Uncharacterized protein n=1 Tax=Martelella alba TaxID=2590451 RepID=A0ABY2SLL7_9HYPH|nr:hypothetical protein FCN80_10945 [Martelella alba]
MKDEWCKVSIIAAAVITVSMKILIGGGGENFNKIKRGRLWRAGSSTLSQPSLRNANKTEVLFAEKWNRQMPKII